MVGNWYKSSWIDLIRIANLVSLIPQGFPSESQFSLRFVSTKNGSSMKCEAQLWLKHVSNEIICKISFLTRKNLGKSTSGMRIKNSRKWKKTREVLLDPDTSGTFLPSLFDVFSIAQFSSSFYDEAVVLFLYKKTKLMQTTHTRIAISELLSTPISHSLVPFRTLNFK